MNDQSAGTESSPTAAPGLPRRLVRAGMQVFLVTVPVAGLLTFFANALWLCDLMANLRLQLMIAGAAAVLITLLSRQWKTLAVQLLLVVVHLTWVAAPPDRAAVAHGAEPSLSVTSVNVYVGNREFDRIADVLLEADADVLTVTELTPPLFESLQQSLHSSHPYVAAEPGLGAFGVAIFSRYPLSDVRLIGRPRAGSSLLATVTAGDGAYRVAATHPVAPMTAERFAQRNEHLEQLSELVQSDRRDQPGLPFIITGDFNLTPWSPHFEEFQQTAGLRHVVEGSGVEPTWYARGVSMFPLGLALDHCLVSDELVCVSHRIGPSVASDHLPITVRLSRRPTPRHTVAVDDRHTLTE